MYIGRGGGKPAVTLGTNKRGCGTPVQKFPRASVSKKPVSKGGGGSWALILIKGTVIYQQAGGDDRAPSGAVQDIVPPRQDGVG